MMALFRFRTTVNLLGTWNGIQNIRNLSNKSAVVTRTHRKMFLKLYPTIMVRPDGSTFSFRHHEPRRIITLPLNLSKLSDEERAYYLEKRKPKKKVVVEEEIEDNFNSNQYLKLIKRN